MSQYMHICFLEVNKGISYRVPPPCKIGADWAVGHSNGVRTIRMFRTVSVGRRSLGAGSGGRFLLVICEKSFLQKDVRDKIYCFQILGGTLVWGSIEGRPCPSKDPEMTSCESLIHNQDLEAINGFRGLFSFVFCSISSRFVCPVWFSQLYVCRVARRVSLVFLFRSINKVLVGTCHNIFISFFIRIVLAKPTRLFALF